MAAPERVHVALRTDGTVHSVYSSEARARDVLMADGWVAEVVTYVRERPAPGRCPATGKQCRLNGNRLFRIINAACKHLLKSPSYWHAYMRTHFIPHRGKYCAFASVWDQRRASNVVRERHKRENNEDT